MKPVFITALGARSSRPTIVKIHDRPNANTTTSAIARTTPPTPPAASKPMITPSTTTIVEAIT